MGSLKQEENMIHGKIIRADRIRKIEKPFGWIPFRILTSGIMKHLSSAAMLLYFFLCLVSDEYGMSFYRKRKLSLILKLPEESIDSAREELCAMDLIAFNEGLYQVLSIPETQSLALVGANNDKVNKLQCAVRRNAGEKKDVCSDTRIKPMHIGDMLRCFKFQLQNASGRNEK